MGMTEDEMRERNGLPRKNPIYKISFYRKMKNGFVYWYADVPDHTEEENEMVMGADSFLETLADGKDKLTALFTTKPTERNADDYLYHFSIKEHDEEGAYYISDEGVEIWICNVTHDVCGEHPMEIYIQKII